MKTKMIEVAKHNGKRVFIKITNEDMEKGKKDPIGTVATWADGKKYRKVSENRWEPVDEGKKHSDAQPGHDEKKDTGHMTPAKMHEKFRVYMEGMSDEHRAVFRGGKMEFDKNRFVAPNGKVALKYDFKNDKVSVMKLEEMKKALTPEQQEKVEKVMKEFYDGKLKSSNGKKVTSKDQALAIAYSYFKDMKKAGERPGHKYYKRIPKKTGKGYLYFYNKSEYDQYKKSGTVPDQKKNSIWSGIMSFFGLKDEKKAEEKVKSLHESNKDKLAGVSFKVFTDYLNEYVANKEKWDKRFSASPKEKGESKGGGEKKETDKKKESGEKKSSPWNVKLMKMVAEIAGGGTAEKGMKEAADSIQELRDSLPAKQFEMLQHVLDTYHDRGTNMAVTKKDVQNLERLKNTGLVHITTYMNGDGSIGLTEKGKKFAGQFGYAYSEKMAEFEGKKKGDKTEITSHIHGKQVFVNDKNKWQTINLGKTDSGKYRVQIGDNTIGIEDSIEKAEKKLIEYSKEHNIKLPGKEKSPLQESTEKLAEAVGEGNKTVKWNGKDVEVFDSPPAGFHEIKGGNTAPKGYILYGNDKTRFAKNSEHKSILVKDNRPPLETATEKLAEAVGEGKKEKKSKDIGDKQKHESFKDYYEYKFNEITNRMKEAQTELKQYKNDPSNERAKKLRYENEKANEELNRISGPDGQKRVENEYRKIAEQKKNLSRQDKIDFPDLTAEELKKKTGLNWYYDEELGTTYRAIRLHHDGEQYHIDNISSDGNYVIRDSNNRIFGRGNYDSVTPEQIKSDFKKIEQEKQTALSNAKKTLEADKKAGVYSDAVLKHKDGTYKTRINYDPVKLKSISDPDERKAMETVKARSAISGDMIKPVYVLHQGAMKDGVWTDSKMLIHDKNVTKKIYDVNKQNQFLNYKKRKVNQLSDEKALLEVSHDINNASELQFPNWQQVMPKELPKNEAHFTGWFDPDPKKVAKRIEYSDGETTVFANADMIATVKSYFPTAKMYLTGTMSPIAFKVGNEIKAVVMPIQRGENRSDNNPGMINIKNQIEPKDNLKKATDILSEELQKAKKAESGEVRTHKDGTKWKKVGPNKWEPVKEGKEPKGKKKPEPKKDEKKKPEEKGDKNNLDTTKRGTIKNALKKVAGILADALSGRDSVHPTGAAIEDTGEDIKEKQKENKKIEEQKKLKQEQLRKQKEQEQKNKK